MEFLLAALAILAIPVCAIAGFVMALNLKAKVRLLEQRLAAAEQRLAAGPVMPPLAATPSAAPPERPTAPVEQPDEREDETATEEPVSLPAPPVVPPIPQAPSPVAPEPALPKAARQIEEQIGARWAVWIGGLALALGGIFLVRYSIEAGLLGPRARIAAGATFALALVVAGEWLRRRETTFSLGRIPSAHIPSVVTAAGTLTAFATVYAAHALYGMIGPGAAFVLLGAVALLAIVASTLHGPGLAGLGLVGALATPLLVSSQEPQVWPVVLYLAFVVTATYAVARLRLWRWLAIAAAVGALGWGLLFRITAIGELGAEIGHLVIEAVLAGLFLVVDPHRRTADDEARLDPFGSLVLCGFAALAVLILDQPQIGAARPLLATAMVALLAGLAVRFPAVAPGAVAAGAVAVGTLFVWPVAAEIAAEAPRVLPGPLGIPTRPEALTTFLAFAAAASLGIAGATFWRVLRGAALPLELQAWLLSAAALTPPLVLVLSYLRVAALDRSVPFAIVAALLGLAYAAAARRLAVGGPRALSVGVAASAGIAALALGLTFALDKGILTVAFALAALGTAFVADRTGVPALRYAVAALGVVVAARLAWNPSVVPGSPGSWPILNWLLWGYGAPALAFFLAARLLDRGGRDRVARFVESLSIVFSAFLVFFEIRHAVHGSIDSLSFDHLEAGLQTTAALAFAIVLTRLDRVRGDVVDRVGSALFSALAILLASVGLLVAANPLLNGDPVLGGRFVNSLLPAYLLPAVLAGLLTLEARRGGRPQLYQQVVAVLALALQLAWLVMAIRRVFQGPVIDIDLGTGEAEQWTYSLGLLACGLTLLIAGAWTRSQVLRLGSLVYLALAVLKVFIVDLASLEGILRALSFIGLGLTLIGIAFMYQRLLGRQPAPAGS